MFDISIFKHGSEAFGSKLQIFQVSFVSQFPKDLDTKKTTPNIEVCPETIGAMFEYWYIERGLFKSEQEVLYGYLQQGSKLMLANSRNASDFDNLQVRKISISKQVGVRIIHSAKHWKESAISLTGLLEEKILLAKLCKWTEI